MVSLLTVYDAGLFAINFAFQASLIASVHTAVQIALTSAGSPDKSVATRLSDASSVPGCNTYLSKDLVSSVPSFLFRSEKLLLSRKMVKIS